MAQRSPGQINAEIYGELATNLFKLEKVCQTANYVILFFDIACFFLSPKLVLKTELDKCLSIVHPLS